MLRAEDMVFNKVEPSVFPAGVYIHMHLFSFSYKLYKWQIPVVSNFFCSTLSHLSPHKNWTQEESSGKSIRVREMIKKMDS